MESVAHDAHLGGMPPQVVLGAEKALADVLGEAARRGLLSSAHDVSEGGLGVALAESAFRNGLGFAVTLPGDDPTVALFLGVRRPRRRVAAWGGLAEFEHCAPRTGAGLTHPARSPATANSSSSAPSPSASTKRPG